jgi:chromosomal replication initiator protein
VAEHFDVKIADLRGPRRHRTIAHPRSVAMYLCRKHSQASFPQIGESFGGKDHTTVIHACKKIEAAVATDPALRSLLQSIERKLPA